MPSEFTLTEARDLLGALRAMAPDDLRAPLSPADLQTVLAAGVEVKSIEQGLLDFPTTIAGVPAYWCWQSGEDEIEWWHPRGASFAARRPIGVD
jgi:hypothetical protein